MQRNLKKKFVLRAPKKLVLPEISMESLSISKSSARPLRKKKFSKKRLNNMKLITKYLRKQNMESEYSRQNFCQIFNIKSFKLSEYFVVKNYFLTQKTKLPNEFYYKNNHIIPPNFLENFEKEDMSFPKEITDPFEDVLIFYTPYGDISEKDLNAIKDLNNFYVENMKSLIFPFYKSFGIQYYHLAILGFVLKDYRYPYLKTINEWTRLEKFMDMCVECYNKESLYQSKFYLNQFNHFKDICQFAAYDFNPILDLDMQYFPKEIKNVEELKNCLFNYLLFKNGKLIHDLYTNVGVMKKKGFLHDNAYINNVDKINDLEKFIGKILHDNFLKLNLKIGDISPKSIMISFLNDSELKIPKYYTLGNFKSLISKFKADMKALKIESEFTVIPCAFFLALKLFEKVGLNFEDLFGFFVRDLKY